MSKPKWCPLLTGILIAFGLFPAFAQGDISPEPRKHLQEIDERNSRLTKDENKLESSIFEVMRLAEDADTSAQKAQKLRLRLSRIREFKTDSLDRILVAVVLTSTSRTDEIVAKIKSLGGEVITIRSWIPSSIRLRLLWGLSDYIQTTRCYAKKRDSSH